jgi:hypothetical protein
MSTRHKSKKGDKATAWSEWAWDAGRNQWGRYRMSQGQYEYEWRDPEPSTTSSTSSTYKPEESTAAAWSEWAWDTSRNQWGRYRNTQGKYEYEWRDPEPSTSSTSKSEEKGKGKEEKKGNNSQTLSIVVYRGDPVDAQSTRHTSFFIEFSDGGNLVSHVTGGSGFFQLEEKWNTSPPYESRHFERMIPVVTAQTPTANNLNIRNTIYSTPINNAERAWNCQTWIGDGLRRLQEAELIPATTATRAADQMVDVLMEAPDQD